jgi:crotonobetainyl-CoA:carnitine CoA-transferase CaiB-like acyl-CoA transferase
MIVPVEHAKLGTFNVTAPPLHMHGTPASVRLGAARARQHTEEVLGELGLDATEVAELVKTGVVATQRATS